MSKYVFIEKGNKSIDELSREFQKVFYRKAALIENKGKNFSSVLRYYCCMYRQRKIIKVMGWLQRYNGKAY